MVNRVMYRASVVERRGHSWRDYSSDPNDAPRRWLIPVLFRSDDDAFAAAVKAAQRKAVRFGGEWSVEVERERVVIV
jgi:hypothetical protein